MKNTIETYTFYGKYHYSGHRNCGVSFSPEESKEHNQICPKCGNKLTIGVADRIEKLADRPVDYKRGNAVPFVSLVPLHELISGVYDIKQLYSKKVWEIYSKLIKEFGNEFSILLNVSRESLIKIVGEKLANVI
ncbi:MAG: DNA helicase UvrD, partial [Nanoarchaeota archaeon]